MHFFSCSFVVGFVSSLFLFFSVRSPFSWNFSLFFNRWRRLLLVGAHQFKSSGTCWWRLLVHRTFCSDNPDPFLYLTPPTGDPIHRTDWSSFISLGVLTGVQGVDGLWRHGVRASFVSYEASRFMIYDLNLVTKSLGAAPRTTLRLRSQDYLLRSSYRQPPGSLHVKNCTWSSLDLRVYGVKLFETSVLTVSHKTPIQTETGKRDRTVNQIMFIQRPL